VVVGMVVPVGMNCVDVRLKGVRVIVLMFRRRVWTVLTTGLVVSVQNVAIRSGLPDIVTWRAGEGALCFGGGRRKVGGREGVAVAVAVAVTMMVALRVGAQREGIARSHVYRCRVLQGSVVGMQWCCREGGSEVRRFLGCH